MSRTAAVGRVVKAGVEVAGTQSRPNHREAWKNALVLVIVTRLAFLLVAWAAAWLLAAPDRADLFVTWNRWDASLFLRIAEHGYTHPFSDPHATAFFPLFPLMVGALGDLGLNLVGAGMLVSFVGSVVACAYLFMLAEEEIGAGAGRRCVLYLLLFPTAVFLVAGYSEALFLAGAIPAFFYARHGRWLAASIPATIAMASRLAGLFLIVGLIVEFISSGGLRRQKEVLKAAAMVLVALSPLLVYMAYLWAAKGDPLYFLTDQKLGWGRSFPENPITAFKRTWDTGGGDYPPNWIFAWRVEIVAAEIGVVGALWLAWRRQWGYAAYTGAAMAALVLSSWYFSVPRVLVTLFPLMLLLARATQNRPMAHDAALVVLAPLAGMGVVVFTHSAWFF